MIESKNPIKTLVRGAYDFQKLRIQMGNRVVGNFKAKLGQSPGTKEDDMDAEAKALLVDLRQRYQRLADALGENPRIGKFEGDEVISTFTDFLLVQGYVRTETEEAAHFKRIEKALKGIPVYDLFLEQVKGVGPAMAGVLLSEFDVHRAPRVSSFWAYAGLDVVTRWVLYDGDPDVFHEACPLQKIEQGQLLPDEDGRLTILQVIMDGKSGLYRLEENGGRSRRREHLVERDYTDKEGKPAKRMGITFNPFLKTKLYVLATSFVKQRDGYREIYDGYKHRLENSPHHVEKSKGHRHNMAMRYMVKMFLKDFWEQWRQLEGLPTPGPYSEDKLGLVHGADAVTYEPTTKTTKTRKKNAHKDVVHYSRFAATRSK